MSSVGSAGSTGCPIKNMFHMSSVVKVLECKTQYQAKESNQYEYEQAGAELCQPQTDFGLKKKNQFEEN